VNRDLGPTQEGLPVVNGWIFDNGCSLVLDVRVDVGRGREAEGYFVTNAHALSQGDAKRATESEPQLEQTLSSVEVLLVH